MIVVDTNILIYHLISGLRNRETEALARRDSAWAAPLLWRSELRNVLAGYLRRRELTSALACEIVQQGRTILVGGEYSVEDAVVFDLVSTSKCTAYDCEFVALAIQLDVPLITEDADLLKAFPSRCRSLSESLAG